MATASTTPDSSLPAAIPQAARRALIPPVLAYIVRRIGLYLLTLWGAFTVAFMFFHLIPGNPVEAFIASLQQNQIYNVQASKGMIDYYNKVFGLNGNLLQQYLNYLNQVVIHHNLGPALLDYPEPSQVIIMRALPWTIGLLGLSAVISFVLGLLLGALCGWARNSRLSRGLTNFALAFSHVPYYFVALMLIFILAYRLDWFPSQSAYAASLEPAINLQFVQSVIHHGFLPALSIVFIGACNWLISTRMLLVTTLGEDYLTFADAKGLNPRRILLSYALRNAYLPQITAFGISLGYIFNGNVLVEQLF
ncbi:MAG: ABC transporter permease, partial [Chloroflexi bacterium]|nr:ABC transporter permease [Chloroflexota bacterium]